MRKFLAGTVVSLGLMSVPLSAFALVINIDTYLNGSLVGDDVTLGTLTLIQNGSNVDFNFFNSVGNLGLIGDDAFISKLFFSYDGDPALTKSSFINFGGAQTVTAGDFKINPGKDSGYDFFLALNYPTRSANRFINGEFTTWTISGVSVDDFTVSVSGSGPAALAMVHIQQVGEGKGGEGSLKYVGSGDDGPPPQELPEPATLALLGLGLLGIGVTRRYKK